MLDLRLYLLQRVTALIMVPLVLGHLAVMIYAIQGGLSADEILARTRGSLFWASYYGLFVLAVSIHAAIGLRVIAHEWLGLRDMLLDVLSFALFIVLLILGGQAVWAVAMPGLAT